MNVLIYGGSTNPASRISRQLQDTLGRTLCGAYDIKLVDPQVLNHQPWQHHTSLVVFPNLDQSEHDALPDHTRRTLRQWVGRGGRFLGMGTGAGFAGQDHLDLVALRWARAHSTPPGPSSEPLVLPHREITIFLQNANQPVQLPLDADKALFTTNLPARDEEENQPNIWASYRDDEDQERVVAVWSSYQAGCVALVGFDLSSNLERLTELLNLMGMEGLNPSAASHLHLDLGRFLTLYLLSCLSLPDIQSIHQGILDTSVTGQETKKLQDAHDTFTIIHDIDSSTRDRLVSDPFAAVLTLCSETTPRHSPTLSFDLGRYFSFIDKSCALGSTVLYGETVPSTQTLLDKSVIVARRNSKLGDLLPSGTVCIANKQTKGRGRGANNWISTCGSVQFSLLVKAASLGSSLVFVQYLFGLAVIEWIEKKFDGKLLVRLKWPNDIYGSTGGELMSDFKKIGGILVNCSFGGLQGTQSKLVIGLGLNHHLAPHSTATSLAELVYAKNNATGLDHLQDARPSSELNLPSVEETIAGILTCFGQMWNRFEFQGFEPFMSRYLSRWLHTYLTVGSGQVIKYEKTGERLKILGLDPSFGLLRTELIHDDGNPLPTTYNKESRIINLQPDSNSFDIFSGLIKAKC